MCVGEPHIVYEVLSLKMSFCVSIIISIRIFYITEITRGKRLIPCSFSCTIKKYVTENIFVENSELVSLLYNISFELMGDFLILNDYNYRLSD